MCYPCHTVFLLSNTAININSFFKNNLWLIFLFSKKKVWLFNFFVPIWIFCFYGKIKLTYLLTYLALYTSSYRKQRCHTNDLFLLWKNRSLKISKQTKIKGWTAFLVFLRDCLCRHVHAQVMYTSLIILMALSSFRVR